MTPENPNEQAQIDQIMQRRREIFALAARSGIPAFQEVEPPGGYELTGQAGDLIEGAEIDLEQTA